MPERSKWEMWKDPRLGDTFHEEDGSIRLYTMRGWVHLESPEDLEEELRRLRGEID